jgi:hypothetical protein
MVYGAFHQSYLCFANRTTALLPLVPINQLLWRYATARTSFGERPRVFLPVLGNTVCVICSPFTVPFVQTCVAKTFK